MLGRILGTLFEAVTPLVLVRILTKTDLGILIAALLVYETIATILTAGFPAVLMYQLPCHGLADRRAIVRHVLWTLLGLAALAGSLLALIGLTGGPLVDAFSTWVSRFTPGGIHVPGTGVSLRHLAILAIFPLGDMPVRVLPNLLIVEGRARASAAVSMARSIGMAAATVLPVLLSGAGIPGIVATVSAFGILEGILAILCVRWIYRGVQRTRCSVGPRELLRMALPLGATEIVRSVNVRLDRLIVLALFSVAQLAEYYAGAWQIPLITTIPYSVGAAYMPRFVELYKAGRPREVLMLWRSNIAKVSLLVVPLTMVFVIGAEEAMGVLFTQEYAGAAWVFRWYAILTLGRVMYFGGILVAAGAPEYMLQATALSLAVNLVASIPLAVVFGVVGPAMGTCVAFVAHAAFCAERIARSSGDGIRTRDVLPLARYCRVVGATLPGAVLGSVFKMNSGLPPVANFVAVAAIVLAGFAAVGTATRLISRDDWAFMRSWLMLKGLRTGPSEPAMPESAGDGHGR